MRQIEDDVRDRRTPEGVVAQPRCLTRKVDVRQTRVVERTITDCLDIREEEVAVEEATAALTRRAEDALHGGDGECLHVDRIRIRNPENAVFNRAQVREITERAMRGEIDFRESFKERVALLKGLDVSVMQEIAENLPITEGVERLMRVLKRAGYKIAILSGGFTYFGNYLKHKFGIDYVYANELEIVDGKLTGNYLGEIVDGQRKAELLKLLAQVENVDIAQTIAVGDGANDLPMITVAGLGIAFHAKPKVKQTARQSISTIGLDGVLYFLGFKDSFINEP